MKAHRKSPYHPQTVGVVDSVTQTLKEMLCKTANQDSSYIETVLIIIIVHLINLEVHQESTGFPLSRYVKGPLEVF